MTKNFVLLSLIGFLLTGIASCNSSTEYRVTPSQEPVSTTVTPTRSPTETMTEIPSSTELPAATRGRSHPVLLTETQIDLRGVQLKGWTYYETPSAVWGLALAGPNTLWLEYGDGKVCRLELGSGACTVFRFDASFHATRIVSRDDFDQGVWVASQKSGSAKRYYQGKWTDYPFGSVFAFSAEAVWAADRSNLYRIAGEHMESYERPPGKPNSIAVAPDGSIWVSLVTFPDEGYTTSKGVWQFDGESWEIIPGLDDGPENIYHLVTTADGSIWAISEIVVGTNEPGHIKKYDGQKWVLDAPNDLWLGGVGETADLDGNLWILTSDALKFDGSAWMAMGYDQEIANVFSLTDSFQSYALAFSPSGMVCLGTDIGVFCKDQAQ